ncbi:MULTISPECIES: C45 family peptidase [Oxalobacteraceae]|uniref:C45 family autoproteolytic acyltransferase/hydolase n=1 Tax=Oxalobacteraceae TaxID=75682 RepID=UPI001455EBA3|nr:MULTISPECIES: C45 family peptidase [Oxalobacteraceae]
MTRIIEGKPYAIGEALGRLGRHAIKGLLECADWQRLQKWRGGRVLCRLIDRTKKTFPAYWDEICGMGAGLGMDPADVFLWNCRCDLLAATGIASSSIAINRLGAGLVAQNLCDQSDLASASEVLDIRPEGKPGFLALSMPGCLPGFGCAANRAGIVQIVDNIEGGEFSFGIPSAVIARAVLDTSSLGDAIELAIEIERVGSCHHILAAAGEFVMVGIEADSFDSTLVPISNKYWHTNHLLRTGTADYARPRQASVDRHRKLGKLLEQMPSHPMPEDVLSLLDSSISGPCDLSGGREVLIPAEGNAGTAFFKITQEQIHVSLLRPCDADVTNHLIEVEDRVRLQ